MTPHHAQHVSRRPPLSLAAAIMMIAVIALLVALLARSQKDCLNVAKEIFILTITSVPPVLIGLLSYQP